MIYKDDSSCYDNEICPANRDESCLNCGESWGEHTGWSCAHLRIKKSFAELAEDKRYLTQSMKDSLSKKDPPPVLTAQPYTGTITQASNPDWRFWQHHHPGECPCGISRKDCIYHSDRK